MTMEFRGTATTTAGSKTVKHSRMTVAGPVGRSVGELQLDSSRFETVRGWMREERGALNEREYCSGASRVEGVVSGGEISTIIPSSGKRK